VGCHISVTFPAAEHYHLWLTRMITQGYYMVVHLLAIKPALFDCMSDSVTNATRATLSRKKN